MRATLCGDESRQSLKTFDSSVSYVRWLAGFVSAWPVALGNHARSIIASSENGVEADRRLLQKARRGIRRTALSFPGSCCN